MNTIRVDCYAVACSSCSKHSTPKLEENDAIRTAITEGYREVAIKEGGTREAPATFTMIILCVNCGHRVVGNIKQEAKHLLKDG